VLKKINLMFGNNIKLVNQHITWILLEPWILFSSYIYDYIYQFDISTQEINKTLIVLHLKCVVIAWNILNRLRLIYTYAENI